MNRYIRTVKEIEAELKAQEEKRQRWPRQFRGFRRYLSGYIAALRWVLRAEQKQQARRLRRNRTADLKIDSTGSQYVQLGPEPGSMMELPGTPTITQIPVGRQGEGALRGQTPSTQASPSQQ